MQVAKFDVRCPQWALPREEVSIQVKIEKTVTDDIDEIVLDMPPGLRLVDTINVADHSESGGRITVRGIGRARVSEYDYFGIVVAAGKAFDDLKTELPVRVSFHMKSGPTDTVVTPVRIFRPRLEFADAPHAVTLTDDGRASSAIPIRLKFSGFGDITLSCRCTVGGRTVSHGLSHVDDMLEMLAYDRAFGIAGWRGSGEREGGAAPDRSAEGAAGAGRAHHGAAGTLRGPADSGGDEPAGRDLSPASAMIIGALADIQARTLGENVKLESETAVSVPADINADEIVIEFQYADVLGNRYAPIKRAIKIRDQRRAGTDASASMLLAIDVDESGAYSGAEVMEVGSYAQRRHGRGKRTSRHLRPPQKVLH